MFHLSTQTHTWFRFLVRPRDAGPPSRPAGAGLEDSKTALQSKNCHRGPALQVRRRPLLHSTNDTVLVDFVPRHRRRRERKTVAEAQDPPHNRDDGPPCIRQGSPPGPRQAAPSRNRVPQARGGRHHPALLWSSPLHMVRKKDG